MAFREVIKLLIFNLLFGKKIAKNLHNTTCSFIKIFFFNLKSYVKSSAAHLKLIIMTVEPRNM